MPPKPNDTGPLDPQAPNQEAAQRSVANGDSNATTGGGEDSTRAGLPSTGTERYALGEEIARGGMGVIYRATDTALGREVAVKVLQDRFAPDSGVARRFADEARIAAQLQHPGIPPVHDLGILPDCRPFLAMKLIKGQTLEILLRGRTDVAAERGRWVAVFEQVCQAIAYAHSHSVIHRDLKPDNVMVGAFGEVQVMDWGLAKVLTAGTAAADPEETSAGTQVRSVRDSDGSFTQAGSVLGTPAFMPPEQALGVVGKVGARSDVFGLGAVLAVILTGRPPFAAGSAETVRVQAAQGKLDECFARLDVCGADPELVALCKRCLAPAPADRPADAGEVARAVGALRAEADERARRAELERVKAEGERIAAELRAAEQRKRRRVQLALAGAVGLLLLAGLAFAWWARERHARNAEAVAVLLDQCEQALRGEDLARATVAFEAAQRRAGEGGAEEWSARLEGRAADLKLLGDLDAVDQFRWTPISPTNFPPHTAVAARYREALGRCGLDPESVAPEAAAARARGSAVRERITAVWDWLLQAEGTAAVRAALRAVDADSYRDAVRDAVQSNDRGKIADLAGRPAALEQPAEFTSVLGENQAIGVERRRRLLAAAAARRPRAAGVLMTLGWTYPWSQTEERLRWFQAAVAADPSKAAAHSGLGDVLWNRHDLAGAEAAFREAIRLDPQYAWAYVGLGNPLRDTKDLAGAEAAYREALRLDPQFAYAHNGLGSVLFARRDLAGAEAAYREALRLDPQLFWAHHGLGDVLFARRDLVGAEAAYREAIRLDPKFAWAPANLGLVLQSKGDLEGAITQYKEALRLDPKNSEVLSNLPRAERMRQLLPRLAEVQGGKAEPESSAQARAMAWLCCQPFQKRYALAARLFDRASRADPQRAADLNTLDRYNAACCAVLAARGEGKDAPADAAARTALRQQGLGWLRADLVLCQKQAASADAGMRGAAVRALNLWLTDSDLAGVREPGRLANLPAAERAEWEKLWADVKATLAEARKPAPRRETDAGKK
jgi:tetratricopeptide (TPR) repeat protein